MENFALILLLLTAGVGLKRLSVFPESTGQTLNMFVVYVSLPAMVLVQVPKLQVSVDLWVPIVLPWIMLLLSAGMVLLLARALKWERTVTGGLLLVVPLGNTSFLGVPMVEAFFGADHVRYALLYDQLGSFLALATYGAFILATYGGEGRPSAATVLHKVLTFPPFLALLAALLVAVGPWAWPAPAEAVLERIADTLVPVVMVAVGFQLTIRLPRHHVPALASGMAIKLVAAPLIALGLVTLIGVTGEATRVAVFEAGMPPMITAGALAMVAGLAAETMAALVGLGILLSFVTLPVLFALL